MSRKPLFTGAATALITPFRDGRVDFHALGNLIDENIDGGIDALVILGTTGESSTLSTSERQAVFHFAAERIGGRVPAIAGCGSNDTEYTLTLTKAATEAGYDALLVVTPYYNKASEEGLRRHFFKVAELSPLPILLYHVPSRTGVRLSPALCGELSLHENIIGLKEASGDLGYLAEVAAATEGRLDLYSGNDDVILPTLSLGGKGVISVVSNLFPREVHALCAAYFAGDHERALTLQLSLLPLIKALFAEVNPIPVKTALSHLGKCREEFRLPLCEMEETRKKALLSLLDRMI